MKSLAHVIPGALLMLLKDAPLSNGKIGFAWRAAVGPAVDRATHIRLEGHVLIVEATSPEWLREVVRSTPVVLDRLRGFLGADTIERIEVRRA